MSLYGAVVQAFRAGGVLALTHFGFLMRNEGQTHNLVDTSYDHWTPS